MGAAGLFKRRALITKPSPPGFGLTASATLPMKGREKVAREPKRRYSFSMTLHHLPAAALALLLTSAAPAAFANDWTGPDRKSVV